MAKKRKPKTRLLSKLHILPFFFLIIYILFILGRTVWQNYGINQKVGDLENEINQLKEDNKNLENLIQYYQSTTYKDQEARLKLGYQKPGEKVFIVPKEEEEISEEKEEERKDSDSIVAKQNWLRWWQFFFK